MKVLSLPFSERLELILGSDDPASLVQAMPEEEVWLTIKEIGVHDALPILLHTTKDQLQYILDIETWRRDGWQGKETLEWLRNIIACGEKKVLQWVKETDVDAVVLVFKEFVFIRKKESQDDDPLQHEWPGGLSPATLDGVYYYQCLSKEADDIVRPILEIAGRDDHEFYMKLLEAVMTELKSNLEESAFSWRAKRLAEKGFASLEESLTVYKYLSERQIKQLPKRETKVHSEGPAPRYPLTAGGESYPILMLAIAGLKNDPLVEEISLELATVANKVLIADGNYISPEAVKASLTKVLGYVNIGLERLSGADPSSAAKILQERWVLHLFQMGFSELARLRQKGQRLLKSADLSLLDEPLALQIASVLKKRPVYYTGADFRGIDEVREVETAIERAWYLGRMFSEVFGLSAGQARGLAVDRGEVKWSTVFLTAWARGAVSGRYSFSPLTEKELIKALHRMLDGGELKKETAEDFIQWLVDRQPQMTPAEEAHFRWFVEFCMTKFVEEFGELADKDRIEWRFIQGIWVIPAAE